MNYYLKQTVPTAKWKAKIILCFSMAFLFSFIMPTDVHAQGAFSCPADIVKNSDPGQCGATVNFAAIASEPGLTIVYNHPPGALFPVGITSVAARAYDANWNIVSTCNFNVTVLNKNAPVISVENITAPNDKDACGAVVHFATPSVALNCPFQNRTFSYTGTAQSFTVPEGVASIYVDAFGAAGGMAAASDGNTYGYPGLGGRVEATIAVSPAKSYQ